MGEEEKKEMKNKEEEKNGRNNIGKREDNLRERERERERNTLCDIPRSTFSTRYAVSPLILSFYFSFFALLLLLHPQV